MCYLAKLATKNVPQQGCGCAAALDPKCKGVKIAPKQPKLTKLTGIHTNDQFGPRQLDTVKEWELCIPSAKDL